MDRLLISTTPAGCRIVTRPARRPFGSFLLAIFIIGLASVGAALVEDGLTRQGTTWITKLSLLSGAVIGLVFLLCGLALILWRFAGKEVVDVTSSDLHIRYLLGPLVVRTRMYSLDGIKNLQLRKKKYVASGHSFAHCCISFDYDDGEVTFAYRLPEDDVRAVFDGPLKQLKLVS